MQAILNSILVSDICNMCFRNPFRFFSFGNLASKRELNEHALYAKAKSPHVPKYMSGPQYGQIFQIMNHIKFTSKHFHKLLFKKSCLVICVAS